MTIRPIRTEADYQDALARAEALMNAEPNSPELDELDVLATLIERYEDETAPVPPPDPIDAILFRLDQTGRTPRDLRDILGVTRGRVSEILNRKRRLTLDMIRVLSEELDLPADLLLQTHSPAHRGRVRADERPVPDLVDDRLRADPSLDPDRAMILGRMFRAAYRAATDASTP